MENKEIKKEYAFDEKKHIHTYGGKPLSGVTTVLKIISKGDVLIQWSANMAAEYIKENSSLESNMDIEYYKVTPKVLEDAKKAWVTKRNKAGVQGVDTHAIVENIITRAIKENEGFVKDFSDVIYDNNEQIKNFLAWAIGNKIKFLHTEINTYSLDWWVGGICDFVYEKDGKIYIGDIKTAKGIYPENFIQTSAYGKMLIERGVISRVDGMTIVLLSKDGTFQTQDNFDYEGNVKCFESCLFIHRHLEAISK